MKLKLDANGNPVLQDGKPVYVKDDGTEVVLDPPAMFSRITALNREAQSHREAKEQAEEKLKAFDGITDVEAAKKALDTVKNLEDKKLVDAGEVEKVKTAAREAAERQLSEANKAHATEIQKKDKAFSDLNNTYNSEKISGAFKGSKFITDKMVLTADLVESHFGKSFAIKDGKIVATGSDGNSVFSRSKPGELADFEEALEILVEQYPNKDAILKGAGHSGSGKEHEKGRGKDTPQKGNMGGSREERTAAIASRFKFPATT